MDYYLLSQGQVAQYILLVLVLLTQILLHRLLYVLDVCHTQTLIVVYMLPRFLYVL